MGLTWLTNREAVEEALLAAADADTVASAALSGRSSFAGLCPACRKATCFSVGGTVDDEPGHWVNLLEGMTCACGTNGRTRLAMMAWREVYGRLRPSRSLIFERVTPLYEMMSREDPDLIGCEFLGADFVAGRIYETLGHPVRHETMLAISEADNSLDLIMHFDVLEHVPSHTKALNECYRVLRPGGQMLFSVPFFPALDRHLVRAIWDGENVIHLLPEAYHGNPVGDGALVFIHPGWELLQDLSRVGFTTVVGLYHNLFNGIVSNANPYAEGRSWPIVFLATKPA